MEDLIGQAGDATPENLIKDTDMAGFMADVVEASKETPVIVDFWADWCQPCKALTPVLEKVVLNARGAVKLVKVNADQNQELAAQLHVQSLPTVMAFKDGQPVDGFAGAVPESELKRFIEKLVGDSAGPSIDDYITKASELMSGGQLEEAMGLLSQILQADPENLDAIAGLAQGFLKMGHPEKATEVLKTLDDDAKRHPPIQAVLTALEFEENKPEESEINALREKAAANPKNQEAQYNLAEGLFSAGQKEEAAEILLGLIQKDQEWNETASRKLLLKMFEAAGPTDSFTLTYRRKLSSILFS